MGNFTKSNAVIIIIKAVFMIALINISAFSQDNVGIGTTSPHPSAVLELSATDMGFLIPRLTTAQRNAVSSPADGLMIYNDDNQQFEYYDYAVKLDNAT